MEIMLGKDAARYCRCPDKRLGTTAASSHAAGAISAGDARVTGV